jgi:sec-independent protein translocase protein TatC
MPTRNSPENLPVQGHLEELRLRIFYSLGWLATGTCAGLFFAKQLILFLEVPASGSFSDFVVIKPTEVISVYFKVSLYAGAVLAAPAILYNAWQFVKPALPEEADISPAAWSGGAAALFLAGTVFSFKVLLPAGYSFLYGLSSGIASPMISLNSYISFALSILVIGGAMFEMPVLAALLTRMGVVTPGLLRSRRKEAYFGLCVVAAVVTPTTDVFNMLLFALPMAALYELSVMVSGLIHKAGVTGPEGYPYGN